MRMTIKVVTGVSVDDALRATARTPSRVLRERVRTLAKDRLGDGPAFLELEAILYLAEKAALVGTDLLIVEIASNVIVDVLKGALRGKSG